MDAAAPADGPSTAPPAPSMAGASGTMPPASATFSGASPPSDGYLEADESDLRPSAEVLANLRALQRQYSMIVADNERERLNSHRLTEELALLRAQMTVRGLGPMYVADPTQQSGVPNPQSSVVPSPSPITIPASPPNLFAYRSGVEGILGPMYRAEHHAAALHVAGRDSASVFTQAIYQAALANANRPFSSSTYLAPGVATAAANPTGAPGLPLTGVSGSPQNISYAQGDTSLTQPINYSGSTGPTTTAPAASGSPTHGINGNPWPGAGYGGDQEGEPEPHEGDEPAGISGFAGQLRHELLQAFRSVTAELRNGHTDTSKPVTRRTKDSALPSHLLLSGNDIQTHTFREWFKRVIAHFELHAVPYEQCGISKFVACKDKAARVLRHLHVEELSKLLSSMPFRMNNGEYRSS